MVAVVEAIAHKQSFCFKEQSILTSVAGFYWSSAEGQAWCGAFCRFIKYVAARGEIFYSLLLETLDGRRGSPQYQQQQYNRIGVAQQPGAASAIYRTPAAAPQMHANWVTGPLQKEPPKEFVPQLIDSETAYQKPAPDALPDRTPAYPMQGDDPFKVRFQIIWSTYASQTWINDPDLKQPQGDRCV